MEFKYSLSILFSHMGNIFKILLWLLIALVITAGVGAAILIPLGNVFAKTTDIVSAIEPIKTLVRAVVDGQSTVRGATLTLLTQIVDVLGVLAKNPGAFAGLIVGVVFLYALFRFLIGLSYYAVADVVNKIMSSNMRFGIASSMVTNLKSCVKHSLARTAVSLPIDLLCFVIIGALLLGLSKAIGLFVVPILVAVAIIIYSLKATLFSGWLPRMLYNQDERVFANLTRSFTYVKFNFKGYFKAHVITFTLMYLLLVAFTLPTGGLVFLFLPSLYYFLARAIELVGYFKTQGFSFYTDATTVINTVEFGYRQDNQENEEEFYRHTED